MESQIEGMVDELTNELWDYYKNVDQSNRTMAPAEFQAVIYATVSACFNTFNDMIGTHIKGQLESIYNLPD